jgi:hypothetical protein
MSVSATVAERDARRPGDDIVRVADVVMNRGFDLAATPAAVWPWFIQLGKGRAGWYFPRSWAWLIPPRRRGLRRIDPRLQGLAVGDIIPDWGAADATFEIVELEPPGQSGVLVYRSTRGRIDVSWTIVISPAGSGGSRVHLRLRLGPVKHQRLAEVGGGFLDWLTIVTLAAGLRERVRAPAG